MLPISFPHGWAELEGIANRTDFDLKQHSAASGKSMEYFDDETKEHYRPLYHRAFGRRRPGDTGFPLRRL